MHVNRSLSVLSIASYDMPHCNLKTVRIIIFIPSIFQRRKMFKSTHFCRAFETWHKDVLVDILSKGDPLYPGLYL